MLSYKSKFILNLLIFYVSPAEFLRCFATNVAFSTWLHECVTHSDIYMPKIGEDENVTFSAVQANIAPAVSLQDALGI